MNRSELKQANRIVIKIGSSLLDKDYRNYVDKLIRQVNDLMEQDKEIVIVSSGAIFFGLQVLNKSNAPETLPEKQATAAAGQPVLMKYYQEQFNRYNLNTAQVLLTREGIHNRQTYLNASNTMNKLLEMRVVPIINENDTVATDEIQFGDNDTLSVLVSTLVDADLLVILSDVRGLYPGDPEKHDRPIRKVDEIDENIRDIAGPADRDSTTVGGMITKIQAAETLTNSGTPLVIAAGKEKNVLEKIIDGQEVGTLFVPRKGAEAIKGRKRWIGYHLLPKGYIQVDAGAVQAIKEGGTSLLPSGVMQSDGQFERGDAVKILTPGEEEFARGLTNYNRQEVNDLKGCQTDEISDILGHHYFDEIIHRDNMVVFPDEK
ncbi:MAG: glutamate 5-kinase [bacterium]